MLVFVYDRTFEGVLTALFDAYFRREFPDRLIGQGEPEPMFTERVHRVVTDSEKSTRVWSSLQGRVDGYVSNMLMCLWLSEEPGSDELLFRYMRKVFDSPRGIVFNFADDDLLEAKKISHKVAQEGQRLIQFIRFQKASDGTFFAPVAPAYNALPLAIKHFRDRFNDQKWMIYDTTRHYGYIYDLQQVREVTLDRDDDLIGGKLSDELLDADERLFSRMWKEYYKSMTIKERINRKQQRRSMPVRYWKYMTELQ